MSHTTGGDGGGGAGGAGGGRGGGSRGSDQESSPPQPGMGSEPGTGEATSAAARLFDLRMIIALLFAIYGVVLTVMGLTATTDADIEQAGGINLNLWSGLVMLVVAAAFGAWVVLRPLRLPTAQEVAESPSGGRPMH